MANLSDRGSESKEKNNQSETLDKVSSETTSQIKTCVNCGTSKTPLWRGGPTGPRSLCNACGIKSKKMIRALLDLNKDDKKCKKSVCNKYTSHQNNNINSESTRDNGSSCGGKSGVSQPSRRKFLPFGRKVVLQRPRSQQRRKMGEVERAASVLMFMSRGSVYT